MCMENYSWTPYEKFLNTPLDNEVLKLPFLDWGLYYRCSIRRDLKKISLLWCFTQELCINKRRSNIFLYTTKYKGHTHKHFVQQLQVIRSKIIIIIGILNIVLKFYFLFYYCLAGNLMYICSWSSYLIKHCFSDC